jgi:hypothetical protein
MCAIAANIEAPIDSSASLQLHSARDGRQRASKFVNSEVLT